MTDRLSDSKVRSRLALTTVGLLFGGAVLVLLARLMQLLGNDDTEELLKLWAAYYGTPAGLIFGYYFGTSSTIAGGMIARTDNRSGD